MKQVARVDADELQRGIMLDVDHKIDIVTRSTQSIHQKLDLARLPTAAGASFDSHMEEHNAICLPETRTELLQLVREWASNGTKPIFWLSGMAGTGKSTIARTIAQSFAKQGTLGASFFFKKGEGDRGNASRFFTTIAQDLINREPGMAVGIKKALDEDPSIAEKALKEQFEKLILHPLLGVGDQTQGISRTIVIDALDECGREEDIRAILQLLAKTRDISPVSLKVLVTSRPELPIRLGFREMPDGSYENIALHAIPENIIERDIRLFFEFELSSIRQQRSLSKGWPTTDQIQTLVELAVPLFIFAATVCRYIGSKSGDPEEYLNQVLKYRKSTFSQLDRTYLPILDQLLAEQEEDDRDSWLDGFRELVGSIVLLQAPLSTSSLAGLLQIPQQQIRLRLDCLHSVLDIPSLDEHDAPVRLLHLSFREFLVDPRKQGKSLFWVDEKVAHKRLLSHCLKLMSSPDGGLRQDICNLSRPGTLRSEINDGTIARCLSPQLQYACRYWVDHLAQSREHIHDGGSVHIFLQKYFLNWLEALSLMKETPICIHLIEKLERLTDVRTAIHFYLHTILTCSIEFSASEFGLPS